MHGSSSLAARWPFLYQSGANIVQKWRSGEMIESQHWNPEAAASGLKNPSLRQILLSDYWDVFYCFYHTQV